MGISWDRISDLPEEVLMHILSLLSTKEAVRTCVLSKRWRNTWASVPILKFDLKEFWTDYADIDNDEKRKECEDKFQQFVNCLLENRGTLPLDMFQYSYSIADYYSEASVEWLDRVVLLMPRVISFRVSRENLLHFPNSVFSCASLQKIELDFHTYDRNTIRPDSINLPSLKTLELNGAEIDDDFAQKLFSGCPVLDSLVLNVCDLNVSGISSNALKQLFLYECWQPEQMRISCPGLYSLVIQSENQEGGISLENMVSLVNAEFCIRLSEFDNDLDILHSLSNVSTLRLDLLSAEFKQLLEDNIPDCRTFNNLKSLEIAYWDTSYDFDLVAYFLKHSPSLQELILHLKEPQKRNLEEEYPSDEYILEEYPSQEKLGDVSFQREHLETIRIIRSRYIDVLFDQLISNLHAHIKSIGKIIVS